MAKTLTELLALLPSAAVYGDLEKSVEALVVNSREVVPGAMFICLPGAKVDGHDYISDARRGGAAVILVEKAVEQVDGMTVIQVPDTRVAMQTLAPYFFDYPARKLRLLGVTGTNGKTTTTYLIRSILLQAGFKVGIIGTIETVIGDRILPVKNTTPDVVTLQSILAEMVTSGMDYVVMEVSSHALALGRVAGCEFDAGIFTNMTRDHLDFHVTFENYIAAKALLFKSLGSKDAVKTGKVAIINTDDLAAVTMLENSQCPTITYGINKLADVMGQNISIKANGTAFDVASPAGNMSLVLKVTGIFNVYNVLAAVGMALAEGIKAEVITAALEAFVSVPGRFELIHAGQPFSIIVDFAHTPDGLKNILETAQQFAQRRIIIVFGCGGDRDKTKRPIMGKLAAEYGDVVIATSDNPRTEDPEVILKEVEAGITSVEDIRTGRKIYEKISNRKQAITRALHLAEKDDVVIIAGKGHESYQILKDRTIHFDDREVVREVIREMR